MDRSATRTARVVTLFHRLLNDGDSASFLDSVIRCYTAGSLLRLLDSDDAVTRRAAALALSSFGSESATIRALAQRLSDSDRGVRLAADDSFRNLLRKAAGPINRRSLETVGRLCEGCRFEDALKAVHRVVDAAPTYAEAHFQLAAMYQSLGAPEHAVEVAQHCLRLCPVHYPCWMLRGEVHLALGQHRAALRSFNIALAIYPDLEPARVRVRKIGFLLNRDR